MGFFERKKWMIKDNIFLDLIDPGNIKTLTKLKLYSRLLWKFIQKVNSH